MKDVSQHDQVGKIIFSEQNHQKLFNSMLDPVIIYKIDENGDFVQFVLANNAFFHEYGYLTNELDGLNLSAISAEKEKLSDLVRSISAGKVHLFETIHQRKAGSIFPVEVHSQFIALDGQRMNISTIRNITIRKEAEERLVLVNQYKENILKAVSHDLRSPLAQIQGLVKLMKNEQVSESFEKYLGMVEGAGKQAENIVSELLASDNLENRKSGHPFKKLNVNVFCDKISQNYKLLANSKKGIDFIHSLPDQEIFVSVDENRLTRVFDNIVSNAIKFSQSNSVIEFEVEVKEEIVRFSVKDFGVGIPNELKSIIFDKQSKAMREGTSGEESTGLGLSIAKGIVKQFQGDIWFESEQGQGTIFFVTLPLKRD